MANYSHRAKLRQPKSDKSENVFQAVLKPNAVWVKKKKLTPTEYSQEDLFIGMLLYLRGKAMRLSAVKLRTSLNE